MTILKAKNKKLNPTQPNPTQTKPNQTKPNQTKPNQTKPNQTKPNQTSKPRALQLQGSLAIVRRERRFFNCSDNKNLSIKRRFSI
jgi:hypothetical protein